MHLTFSPGKAAVTAALFVLCLLAGCAAPAEPIGVWFGPTEPAQVTFESLAKLDATARVVRTPHYNIYTTVDDDDLLRKIAQLMEGSLGAYHSMAPDVPLTTYPMECYLFARRDQWAEFTREHTGEMAGLYLQINRGGYTVGDWYVAYYVGEGSTLSVAAHEAWHQYVARHFKGRLPPFLEEGLATMFEGVQFEDGLPKYNLSINQDRAIMLRSAIDSDSLWPLEDVIGMHAGMVVGRPANKIDAFYAQAWGLGRFFWDADGGKYRPALRQLLTDTANGTVFDPTGLHRNRLRGWSPVGVKAMLEHYLGMDFDQIDLEYNRYIRQVAYKELPLVERQPD